MWKTPSPASCCRWEPFEVRTLKRQLANVSCNCRICSKVDLPAICRHEENEMLGTEELYKDEEVQVVAKNNVNDQFIQVTPPCELTGGSGPKDILNCFHRDTFCPSCFVTFNLLRGAASLGTSRILKDTETETKLDWLHCDKSTEKLVDSVEKTTSYTMKPTLKLDYSNASFTDSASNTHSNTTISTDQTPVHPQRQRSAREVTFLLNYEEEERALKSENKRFPLKDCVCAEAFIATIRPPLVDFTW